MLHPIRLGRLNPAAALAPWDASAAAYFDAMTTQPDSARKGLINTLIAGLKADGVWSKLDILQLYAAHDAQAGRLNAINPSQSASAVNSPTFTTDRGYTTNGTTSYLDTNFNPATAGGNLSQDSAFLGVWSRTSGSTGASSVGWFDGTSGLTVAPRDGANNLTGRGNNATTATTSNTDATGFFSVDRGDASNIRIQKNAAGNVTAARASLAMVNNNLGVGRSGTSSYSARQYAACLAGGHLTTTEETALYNRLSTYMTAIGA